MAEEQKGSGIKYTRVEGEEYLQMSLKSKEEKEKEGSSVMEGIGSSGLYLPLSLAKVDGVLRGDDKLAIEVSTYFVIQLIVRWPIIS